MKLISWNIDSLNAALTVIQPGYFIQGGLKDHH